MKIDLWLGESFFDDERRQPSAAAKLQALPPSETLSLRVCYKSTSNHHQIRSKHNCETINTRTLVLQYEIRFMAKDLMTNASNQALP